MSLYLLNMMFNLFPSSRMRDAVTRYICRRVQTPNRIDKSDLREKPGVIYYVNITLCPLSPVARMITVPQTRSPSERDEASHSLLRRKSIEAYNVINGYFFASSNSVL